MPALICGSFSDNNLHSRGSFAGFEKISSTEKHLHTHRGGRWSEFYSDDGRAAQLQFFDRHLRGSDVLVLPPCVSRSATGETVSSRSATSRNGRWPGPCGLRAT